MSCIFNRDFPLGVPSGLFRPSLVTARTIFGAFPVSSSRISSYSFVSQQKAHSKNSPAIIPNPNGKSRLNKLVMKPFLRESIAAFRWLCAVLILFTAVTTYAASQISGSPPVERFVPDLDVYPQNFCIAQDSRHIVYLCNHDGVIEFDGERWKLWRLPNREIVRSIAIGKDDTVYVGGYNAFGVLRREATGLAVFEDLTPRFKSQLGEREFGDIWQTVVTPEGIYFRALRDVFFWDVVKNTTVHWKHEGRFGSLHHHQGKTLLQFRGEGFKVRENDVWRILPDMADPKMTIFEVVPLADGSQLAYGPTSGWRNIRNGKMTLQAMPVGLPSAERISRILSLPDKSVALATTNGLIYVLDPTLTRMQRIEIDSGFISGLTVGGNNSIFVSNDHGIHRIVWPPRWSAISNEQSKTGSIHLTANWGDEVFLLTTSGVYRVGEIAGGTTAFEFMPAWKNETVYDLLPVDRDRAIMAETRQIFIVDRLGRASPRAISSDTIYPRLFRASRYQADSVFVATEFGLRILDINSKSLAISENTPSNLAIRITHFAEISAEELWVGTERHGVWRYRFDKDGRIAEAKRIAEADGLKMGSTPTASVALLADKTLIASTGAGLFRWDGKRFQATAFDGLDKLHGDGDVLTIDTAPNGERWAYSATRVWHQDRQQSDKWHAHDIRNVRRGAIVSHFFNSDSSIVLVSVQGLLIHQAENVQNQKSPQAILPRVLLRSVTRSLAEGKREAVAINTATPPVFTQGDFSIRFEFALPDYAREGLRRYQAQLVGYEREMSDWSLTRAFTYSSLNPGKYTFLLRAKGADQQESEITPFQFVVAPRWYASIWARALFGLIALLLAWVLVQIYTRSRTILLAKRNQSLETKVVERTQELAEANRRLDMMAHIDGLTGIPNRRKFDEYLPSVWQNCRSQRKPLSILIVDVDHFKQYNDTNGHLAGDELLQRVAQLLLPCLRRAEDLLARYGGEEFIAVMPSADTDVAYATAENMRAAIETTSIGVTISIGVATYHAQINETIAAVIKRADDALYLAKKNGRNRVERST